MKRFELIPRLRYLNSHTGATASIYGACPWQNDADSHNWVVIQDGYTIRDNKTGTVGGYNMPRGLAELHAYMVAKRGAAWEYETV